MEIEGKPGLSTVLSKDEEERLAQYVVDMADMGFGLCCNDIILLHTYAMAAIHLSKTDIRL